MILKVLFLVVLIFALRYVAAFIVAAIFIGANIAIKDFLDLPMQGRLSLIGLLIVLNVNFLLQGFGVKSIYISLALIAIICIICAITKQPKKVLRAVNYDF